MRDIPITELKYFPSPNQYFGDWICLNSLKVVVIFCVILKFSNCSSLGNNIPTSSVSELNHNIGQNIFVFNCT